MLLAHTQQFRMEGTPSLTIVGERINPRDGWGEVVGRTRLARENVPVPPSIVQPEGIQD